MSDSPLPPKPGVWDTVRFADIIKVIKSPLSFFALVLLVIQVVLAAIITLTVLNETQKTILIGGLVVLMFLVVVLVAALAYLRANTRALRAKRPPSSVPEPSPQDVEQLVKQTGQGVLFANAKMANLELWYREARPYLHHAAHYSVPTYYLDNRLRVVDWNVAFEIVFANLVEDIQGQHVNWFIARMANHDQAFEHAKQFTRDVQEKRTFPYVDLEPLEYDSADFGHVALIKVASQLTDTSGEGKGWAIALIPTQIDWDEFFRKLSDGIRNDKRWSVYASSYDRVLLNFPPYLKLIQDVVSVVPTGNCSVLDLGAGTGNVTRALVESGHRVTAIEKTMGMLDGFIEKRFNSDVVKLIKASVEHLEFLPAGSFDAAVMVNVLYSLDQPLQCLRGVHRALKPNGLLGLSTTHRETNLDPLLDAIEAKLQAVGKRDALAADWDRVYKSNKDLESIVVRLHTRDDVRDMAKLAGFEIIKEIPSTYEGAVMVLHLRKPE